MSSGTLMEEINLNTKFVQVLIFSVAFLMLVPIVFTFLIRGEQLQRTIILTFLGGIWAVIVLYFFWTRFGGQQVLSPLTPIELMDTRKREVIADISPDEAFELCKQSVQALRSAEFLDIDPEKGRIFARMDKITDILFTVCRVDNDQSEISLVGSIANDETLEYTDNLIQREQATREVIRVLDYLNDYLVRNSSPYRDGNSPINPNLTKSVRLAAILSLVTPGLGQHYCGRFARGLVILVLTSAGIAFYFVPGIIVWVYGIVDAAQVARRVNGGTYPYCEVPPIMLGALIVASIPMIVYSFMGFLLLAYGLKGYEMIDGFYIR